jgi:outer membrane protein OmpA-like peptidoglycan-associated protein
VQEKYALILFDFDKDTIDARNQEIVNQVAARIKELPKAAVEIVGHTDNIGKPAYNIKLSDRRALAVYKLLAAAYGEETRRRASATRASVRTPAVRQPVAGSPVIQPHGDITLEYLIKE